jgi:hypothetical protein
VEGFADGFAFFVRKFSTSLFAFICKNFTKIVKQKVCNRSGVQQDGVIYLGVTQEASKRNQMISRENSGYEGVERDSLVVREIRRGVCFALGQ